MSKQGNKPRNDLIGSYCQKLEPSLEFWLPVPGCPDYFVSDLGRVKSEKRIPTAYLSPYDNGEGYRKFDTRTDGTRKTHAVHRLVAQLFVPNFEQLPEVNHLDGDKDNNSWTNLEWVTQQENIDHAWATGLASKPAGVSGVPGVTWHSSALKWQARAGHKGKRYDLGRYDSIQEAENAIKAFIAE